MGGLLSLAGAAWGRQPSRGPPGQALSPPPPPTPTPPHPAHHFTSEDASQHDPNSTMHGHTHTRAYTHADPRAAIDCHRLPANRSVSAAGQIHVKFTEQPFHCHPPCLQHPFFGPKKTSAPEIGNDKCFILCVLLLRPRWCFFCFFLSLILDVKYSMMAFGCLTSVNDANPVKKSIPNFLPSHTFLPIWEHTPPPPPNGFPLPQLHGSVSVSPHSCLFRCCPSFEWKAIS